MSKVLLSWWRLSRERGKILRRRETAFRAWAKWAPRNHRLKASKRVVQAWTRQSIRASFFLRWATAMHVRNFLIIFFLPSFHPPSFLPPHFFAVHLTLSLSLALSRELLQVVHILFVFYVKIFFNLKFFIYVTLS